MITEETPEPHKRRVRYKGKNPRRFEDKYKELNPDLYTDTVAHVLAGGKTPAGQHVPIMVGEIMQAHDEDRVKLSQRRVFQALRIAVNDEFNVLDGWLRGLPDCLASGGCVAVLSFHSGEDRRVKKAFKSGLAEGLYSAISEDVVRASFDEQRDNPRASSAKLRWAVRATTSFPG